VNTFADKEAAEDREFRRFHSELVGEMRRLSENAGMLTSADLCPVRFRLRQGDERSFPALPVLASLMSVRPGAQWGAAIRTRAARPLPSQPADPVRLCAGA
jgi:hypothetical protein